MTDATAPNLAPRVVAVAPTFDNARTLRAVLDGVAAHGVNVIAVDDGSADGTARALGDWGGEIVTHAANLGKAAALRSGFDRARTLGFTHALTIDTDGQHDSADVPALLAACAAYPRALVLGARALTPTYPRLSRLGRQASNLLVRLIGGVRVADSQCGLRVYPLDVVAVLGARTSRYAFETEVLARAGWAAVPVVEVPVRTIYDVAGGRVTHFRPWRDALSAAVMHTRLLGRALLPWPANKLGVVDDFTDGGTVPERLLRWCNPLRAWRRAKVDSAERGRLALSVAAGLFVGCQPWFGVKTVVCLALAKATRLQPIVVLAASSATTPPVGFAVWAASLAIGSVLVRGRLPDFARHDVRAGSAAEVFAALAVEWTVGALVVGTLAAAGAWAVAAAWLRPTRGGRDAAAPSGTKGRAPGASPAPLVGAGPHAGLDPSLRSAG